MQTPGSDVSLLPYPRSKKAGYFEILIYYVITILCVRSMENHRVQDMMKLMASKIRAIANTISDKDVENFKIYGSQRYEYAYLSEHTSDDIDWDRQYINVCNIDIEVGSENGLPDPATASELITAITFKMGSKFFRNFVLLARFERIIVASTECHHF